MLLQQLIKYAPYKQAADTLTTALNKVHAIAVLVNERKREAENASIILEIQHTIKNRASNEPLLQPSRKMVKMGEVSVAVREGGGEAGEWWWGWEAECVGAVDGRAGGV